MLSIGISGIYNGFNTNTGIYGYAAKAGRGILPSGSEDEGGRMIDGRFVSGAERDKAEKKERNEKTGVKDPSEE